MHSAKTAVLALVLFFGVAVAPASAATIVDIAVGNDNFESLVEAVTAQDLAETLSGAGPFTVFAPTDEAFSELPGYVTRAIEKNPELLTDILLYHVVADDLEAAEVLAKKRIKTVQGESLRVNVRKGSPFVDSSTIVATDIDASNGTIHVIDTVLIPNSVYQAVIVDLRNQVRALLGDIHDVRQDQLKKVR